MKQDKLAFFFPILNLMLNNNCSTGNGFLHIKLLSRDFPGGTVVKNPPANAGDTGSSPGLGRSHMPRSN